MSMRIHSHQLILGFRNVILLSMIVFSHITAAQESVDHAFTISQSATLVDMNGGTQELIGANQWKQNSAVTPIGFEVWFMGKRYTDFSVNCNGVMRFGTTQINPEGNTYNIPGNSRIAIFSCLDKAPNVGLWKTSSTGKVHYKVIGTAPQRKLIIEWKNLNINYLSEKNDATFQAVIHETSPQNQQPQSGQIELIYGKMNSSLAFNNIRIGIGGENGEKKYMGINLSTNPPSAKLGEVSNFIDAGNVPFLHSTTDGNRTKFQFLSPIPDVQAQNLRTICSNKKGIQLNWDLDKSSGNIVGSVLYKSEDGTNYSFIHQTKNIQELEYFDADVDLTKTYWYRVYTVTEGQLSKLQSSGELKVAPNSLQEFDLGNVVLCNDPSVILDASSKYQEFRWYNEKDSLIGTEQQIQITKAGKYYVIVTTPNGCQQKGISEVSRHEPPSFTFDSIFKFCEKQFLEIQAPNGFAQYEWFSENGNKEAEGKIWRATKAGNFYLQISNTSGCFTKKSFTCMTMPIPKFSILGEPFLCEKTPETVLTALVETSSKDTSFHYKWLKDSILLSEEAELTVDEVGIYTVIVSSSNSSVDLDSDCQATQKIEVINCCEPSVKIPNAFTPFSTPDNNEYRIAHHDLITFKMSIYNRWGILVFETDNPNAPWDGTFQGKKLEPSVYQLIIEYTGCRNGTMFQEKKTEAIYLID